MVSGFALRNVLLAVAICAMPACGGAPRQGTADGAGQDAASTSTGHTIEPCRLVTAEQVATVLPNHDGGSVAHAGASLIKGVDAYQCSYVNPATDLLTIIVNVAVDQERFDAIKMSSSYHTDHTQVPIADAAWIWGEDDDLKVQVEKGRAIVDVELMAKRATDHKDALIELTRAAAANVP